MLDHCFLWKPSDTSSQVLSSTRPGRGQVLGSSWPLPNAPVSAQYNTLNSCAFTSEVIGLVVRFRAVIACCLASASVDLPTGASAISMTELIAFRLSLLHKDLL
jgi:hypothetical protein